MGTTTTKNKTKTDKIYDVVMVEAAHYYFIKLILNKERLSNLVLIEDNSVGYIYNIKEFIVISVI